jgi:hypothetical protein
MKRLSNLNLAAALLIGCLLASCTTNSGGITLGGPGTFVGDGVTIADNDLDAVYTMAKANVSISPNAQVVRCEPVFKTWFDSLPGASTGIKISGVLSFAENGFLIVNDVQQGLPDNVYDACGPLYMKVHAQFLNVLAKGALLIKP